MEKNVPCYQRCDVVSGNDPSICEKPLRCMPRVEGCFSTPFNSRDGRCSVSNNSPADCNRNCAFNWDCNDYEICMLDHSCG